MLFELEDEYFTNISEVEAFLANHGFTVNYERLSTLSWILTAQKE